MQFEYPKCGDLGGGGVGGGDRRPAGRRCPWQSDRPLVKYVEEIDIQIERSPFSVFHLLCLSNRRSEPKSAARRSLAEKLLVKANHRGCSMTSNTVIRGFGVNVTLAIIFFWNGRHSQVFFLNVVSFRFQHRRFVLPRGGRSRNRRPNFTRGIPIQTRDFSRRRALLSGPRCRFRPDYRRSAVSVTGAALRSVLCHSS